MGWKADNSAAQSAYVPPSQSVNADAMMGPMLEFMGSQMMMTQDMIKNSQEQNLLMASQMPDASTSAYDIDYESENQTLAEKISQQVSDMDIKRRGVLGTILTSIEDDDDPDATKSSLLTGD